MVSETEQRFESPTQVLEDTTLTDGDKIGILESWKLDLIALQRASQENMPREGSSENVGERLREVNDALKVLREADPSAAKRKP